MARSSLAPLLLLGGGLAAFAMYRKGQAIKTVASNWRIAGFKVVRLNGGNLECQIPIEFNNTTNTPVTVDGIGINVKYQDAQIGSVHLTQPQSLKANGDTVIQVPVSIKLLTLLTAAVDPIKALGLLTSLKTTASVLTWMRANLGLRDCQLTGYVSVLGIQQPIDTTVNLGFTSAPAAARPTGVAPVATRTTKVRTSTGANVPARVTSKVVVKKAAPAKKRTAPAPKRSAKRSSKKK